MIYWLTGQPGAGKTTLGNWIMASFPTKSTHIDGDDMRECFQDKDYSEIGRRRNVERAQNIAKFMHHKGNTVVVSFVSPYRDQREYFKNLMGCLDFMWQHKELRRNELIREFVVTMDKTRETKFDVLFAELAEKL